MILARRSFLTGLGAALITAPAIVRAGSLMPVKAWEPAWIDGVALRMVDHPVSTFALNEGSLALNEDSLVTVLMNLKRADRGLVLRPRFIHVP